MDGWYIQNRNIGENQSYWFSMYTSDTTYPYRTMASNTEHDVIHCDNVICTVTFYCSGRTRRFWHMDYWLHVFHHISCLCPQLCTNLIIYMYLHEAYTHTWVKRKFLRLFGQSSKYYIITSTYWNINCKILPHVIGPDTLPVCINSSLYDGLNLVSIRLTNTRLPIYYV
jgi:hypothetical protein